MVDEVRICLLKELGGTFQMDEKLLTGTNSPAPRYTGPLSRTLNLFSDMTFGNDKLNYTVVMKTSIGILNVTSGYYDQDSCLYSMQTNQSDLGIASLLYPPEGKNLKPHPIYMVDITTMISRYIVLTQTYDSDVMGVFAYAFTPEVWLIFALLSTIFWLMTKLHVHMENKMNSSQRTRDDSLYEVLTHLFQVETIDYTGACMKVVSFFATVLSFMVITYLTNSMKTEIVVVEEPDMINSYDDLLNKPNIRLNFPMFGDTLSRFEFADPQSKERRAYDRSLKFLGGDRNEMIIHPAGKDMVQLIDFMRDVAFEENRRTVGILLDAYATAGKNFACYLKVLLTRSGDIAVQQSTNFYVWSSQDADAKENMLTFAHSAFYKSPYLRKIHNRMHWILAMGFENMWRRFINVLPVDEKMSKREGDIFRSCRADDYRENMPQVDCAPFAPVQFRALAITCGVLLLLSVAAFAREMYLRRPKHPRFGHNKVAAAESSGVADQKGQSEKSARNHAPFGREATVVEAIEEEEVFGEEKRQNALDADSRVEVTSMELFYKRTQAELPLSTIAGPSGTVHRSVQSVQSSCNNGPLRQEEGTEIEVFDQGERPGTLNVQSRGSFFN